MTFLKKFATFFSREDGAVTVDWVALVATVILIGIGLAVAINSATLDFANEIAADVDSRGIMTFGS